MPEFVAISCSQQRSDKYHYNYISLNEELSLYKQCRVIHWTRKTANHLQVIEHMHTDRDCLQNVYSLYQEVGVQKINDFQMIPRVFLLCNTVNY